MQNSATSKPPSLSASLCRPFPNVRERGDERSPHLGRQSKSSAQQRSAPAARKLVLTATGIICLAGTSYFFSTAWGQAGRKEAAVDDVPHRIGLIDINYVMQNYDKLKVLREEFSAEGQAEQEKWVAKRKRFQDLI